MAMNPMQKKARTSFILGVVITLLLTGIVIALLLFYVNKLNTEISTLNANRKKVYVLSQDVKSGEEITEDMFALKAVDQTTIPANATSVISVIESWYMQTKDGTMLNRDEEGLYYTQTDANGSDSIVRVYKEDTTENYYIKPTSTTKQYIELNNVPVVAKLDMKKNTVVTPNMVQQTDNIVSNDVRVEEYNVVSLPVDLTDGDYVDIRLMLPNGQNYIVVSKKIVEIPMGAEGRLADTIRMTLREDEILAMSSAIVEAAGINGAKLYMDEYSFKQFSEDKADNIVVCDNFSNAEDSDFCFVEKQHINTEQINKLIVYRWDKIYPADVSFGMNKIKLNLTETLEFQGYSHEKIVREIYE